MLMSVDRDGLRVYIPTIGEVMVTLCAARHFDFLLLYEKCYTGVMKYIIINILYFHIKVVEGKPLGLREPWRISNELDVQL